MTASPVEQRCDGLRDRAGDRFFRGSCRDDLDSLRSAFREVEKTGANFSMEPERLAIQTIRVGGVPPPRQAGGDRQIEEQGQIRRDRLSSEPVERPERRAIQSACIALIGQGGVAETVTEHDGVLREGRFDDLYDMLAARGEDEERLGFWRDRFRRTIQQERADMFRERGPARLAGFHGAIASAPKMLSQQSGLGRFAAALDAFQRNEQASGVSPALSHRFDPENRQRRRAESYSKCLKIARKGLRRSVKDRYHDVLPRTPQPRMLKASLKRYFLTGLLIMIPFWGTVLILKTLFVSLDGILGEAAASLVTPGYYVPGLGIVALVLLIFVTGLFAANFIGRHVVRQWENLLNRVPVVRGIYSTIKSMMDILSFAERETYRRVVLIQFPKNGHYCFAFVTGVTKGEMQQLSPDPLVHVYVPTSPNPTSGYFLLVPEREVIAVQITVEEAMKLIVSGGLYVPTSPPEAAPQADGKPWAPIKQPSAGVQVG